MIIWNQQSVQRIQAQLLIILILLPCGCRIHAEIESRQILLHGHHHLHKITSHLPIFRHEKCSYMLMFLHVSLLFFWYSIYVPLIFHGMLMYVEITFHLPNIFRPAVLHQPPASERVEGAVSSCRSPSFKVVTDLESWSCRGITWLWKSPCSIGKYW